MAPFAQRLVSLAGESFPLVLMHALVMYSGRVTVRTSEANLALQTRRLAVVVLPQLQAVPGGRLHQMFPAAFEQARIGWMGNGLLHHRRIDDYAF